MATTTVISLKLLVDKKRCKVLFAEANKVFVDFLFQANDVWVAKKFYACDFSQCRRKTVAYDPNAICPFCGKQVNMEVPFVARSLTTNPLGVDGGFMKGMPTYIVTDDLEVKPMSAISCIKILDNFNVKEIGDLEERLVHVKPEEISKLHASSLDSKEVLTKFFLHASALDSSQDVLA